MVEEKAVKILEIEERNLWLIGKRVRSQEGRVRERGKQTD